MSAKPFVSSGGDAARGAPMTRTRTVSWLVLALTLGTAGCPQLVEDDFVVSSAERTASGPGGSAGAGTPSAGDTGAGGSSTEPPGGAGGASAEPPLDCVPCPDGERCRGDGDCESGRCSTSGTCRACGLRLTSVQTACPASCTRCDAGICYIDCEDDGACRGATLGCPPHLACQVACTGAQACESATVTCPAEFPCDISCTGERACRGMTASCTSGPCALTCTADAACEGTSLRCGDDRCEAKCSAGSDLPQVICGDSCDCVACGV